MNIQREPWQHGAMTQFFEQCLPTEVASAVRAAIEAAGPFRTYVAAPQADGVGKGLVRRHDAAMNHYTSKVRAGIVEPLDVFAARTNLFRGVLFEEGSLRVPGVEPLWEHAGFVEAARALSGRAEVVPSMMYVNVLVPGQELPIHTDTPAFVGLDQTNCPEWLLVAMAHSQLFEASRVPMIGAVCFFGDCDAGELVLFEQGPDAPPVGVPVRDNTAVVFDSERVFHGVARVGSSQAPAPPSEVGMDIARIEGSEWRVGVGEREVLRLDRSALRVSVQWKAKCHHAAGDGEAVTRAQAIGVLSADLRARGVIDGPQDDTQLALRMIETYVRFPTAALG